ncbi:MAG: DUF3579 domain-containing protein [Azoarcus sp.]|nr:DUF3579 domain-containing protein [Azoarcus sp.]
MEHKNESFVIVGITKDGKTFRPSDWAERLCGSMATLGNDNRVRYSQFVRPGCTITGQKTVIVDAHLHKVNLDAWQFLIDFAKSHELQVESISDDLV